jgi:SulP family sulfate permease
MVYPLVAGGLLVIVGFPRLTRAIPGPLVAIALLTVLAATLHLGVPTVADKGGIGHLNIPHPAFPAVPHTLQMLRTILPYAGAFAVVGLLESLMTAQLIDDMTSTNSSKNREAWGQGVANVVTGLLGGMGGCAMIGQAIINIKTGGRGRMSTFTAGLSIFVLVGILGSIVGKVPMAALAAVMFVVAANTFDWQSIRPSTIRRLPKSETAVMVVTVVGTIATNDLAIGVVAGVVVACLLFARRTAGLVDIATVLSEDGRRHVYYVSGQLFFASSAGLPARFDYEGDPDSVVIDLAGAAVCDATSVSALDTVVARYAQRGKRAELVNLDRHSTNLYTALSGRLGVARPETLAGGAGGAKATAHETGGPLVRSGS